MDTVWIVLLLFVSVVIVGSFLIKRLPVRRVTVLEYQRGLRYSKGRYAGTLPAGQYWIWSTTTIIVPVDMRPEFVTIPGQEVLSADGVALKVSLASEFEVTDANLAINKSTNYRGALYLLLQVSLREIIGKDKIEDLLQNRTSIGTKLMEMTATQASEYGVRFKKVDMKDIMFAGEMKKAFAQVVKAQKEGQAALERARGETAALRNLANAAKMMEDNPNLLQLRALQSLSDSGGNTLVLGLPNGALPVGKSSGKGALPKQAKAEGDE